MGREIRRVPNGYKHPVDGNGKPRPAFDASYKEALADWLARRAAWDPDTDPHAKGFRSNDPSDPPPRFEDFEGMAPDPDSYMYYGPKPPIEDRPMLVMYEDTTEGTPISPAFTTPEEVAQWCVDNRASMFGRDPGSYEAWLYLACGGWAPSMIATPAHPNPTAGAEAIVRDNATETP